jgi:hypothetical protein
VGHWALLGFGYWAVEEKSSGKVVGETGFANLRRNIEPSLGDTPEIGWVFAAESHGKGYAVEAVRAVIAWGESHLAMRETTCIYSPGKRSLNPPGEEVRLQPSAIIHVRRARDTGLRPLTRLAKPVKDLQRVGCASPEVVSPRLQHSGAARSAT